MSAAITTQKNNAIAPVLEQAIQYRVALNANLWGMPDGEVYSYYKMMCGHLRLDPASHPFDIITDQKTSTKKLYLNSIGTSQLGDRARLSYGKLEIDVNEKLIGLGFKVAHVSLEVCHPDGRSLVAEAFVDLMSGYEGQPLKGNNLINALKKAGTQCRRRGTLQMLGMMPQDAEVPTIKLGELERGDDGFEGVTIEQLPDSALLTMANDQPELEVQAEAEPDSRAQLLIEIEELIEAAKAPPLSRTAKEIGDEIKRQTGKTKRDEMATEELARLKDGLTLWLQSIRKK